MADYAVLMAGGGGKRLWPMGTRARPKQFLSLEGGESMLRATFERILPMLPPERVFVVTVSGYEAQTRAELPELPEGNLLVEPVGKNTAPCIAYAAAVIYSLDPEAALLVLPADHAIGDRGRFLDAAEAALAAAMRPLEGGSHPLVTMGVKPTRADTGYGYIKAGEAVPGSGDSPDALGLMRVERFSEKPDQETAASYLEQGGYYWNSGIFAWRADAILAELREHAAEWGDLLGDFVRALGSGAGHGAVEEFYGAVPPGPVDKLVLERTSRALVVPVDFPWSDIGSWKALYDYLSDAEGGNVVRGGAIVEDSRGCLLLSEGPARVAVLGLEGVVVINTGKVVLVADMDKSQEVRALVERLNTEAPELT